MDSQVANYGLYTMHNYIGQKSLKENWTLKSSLFYLKEHLK